METNWNELNISQAQWSIDSYCLGNTDKKCQPCQFGWRLSQPSCYAINDPPSPEEHHQKYSPLSSGTNGYWVGLRVEDGKWKWVDGSDLIDSSFNADPVEGRCAISVLRENSWVSVSCGDHKQWICQQKALSLSEITEEADYVNAPEGPVDKKATRPALSFVEMKPLNIRGCVGERVTFTCSDWNTFFDLKYNDKYFCRSPCTEDKHIIIKAAPVKTTQQNRIRIYNRGNDLFVTFTNLKKSDTNTYYCGVERTGLDLLIKVNLKVTDAASYCPKRTPDTADTFTTLSSAVSNISTLSSNNKHNITDL
ncbi:hypothetical protein F7725_017867 [Dissostichus mawsoni]|uniref:C-type lectin domain-containing protein n=1 Tax=Dissostichus mawsoni TaxID=36200 RepID=A0A7J5XQ41_DISMA|nr:hypothetical protein F7725_017867 [Dissostichus mawsoni]